MIEIFLIIFSVLLIVSGIFLLNYRLEEKPQNAFTQRIPAWWVLALLSLLSFLLGDIGTILLFCAVSFLILREFLALVCDRLADYHAMVAAFYLILPLQYIFVLMDWYDLFSLFIPVYAFFILPVLTSITSHSSDFLMRAAKIQWAVVVSIFCISHIPAIMHLSVSNKPNTLLIIFLFLIIQASELFSMLWRKLFQQQKTLTTTWITALAGVLFASVLSFYLSPYFTPFTSLQAMLVGFIISVMGFVGHLVMFAIKQDRGIKVRAHTHDYDSILNYMLGIAFAAPVYFHILRHIFQVA